MKRLISLTIIALLIFAIGCSQTAEKEERIPESDFQVDESTLDLGGMVFRIGSYWPTEYGPETGYSAEGDKILARYDELEKSLNITIKVEKTPDESSFVFTEIAAGMPSYSLLDMAGNYAMELYKEGYLQPLDAISTIDLSQDYKYSPENFRRYGIYKGTPYGFQPWAWEFIPQFEGVILYNNEHVRRFGLTNPYEMQENGTWTWDGFRKELENVQMAIAGDEKVLYPMVRTGAKCMGRTAILSNGVDIVIEDENGNLKFNLDNEKAYKALEYLRDLEAAHLMQDGYMPEFSVNAQAVYCSCESYHGTLHSEFNPNEPSFHLNDYGMLPFPSGPDAEYGTASSYVYFKKRLLWIESLSENAPDDIGIVVDRMFEPLDGDNKDIPAWKVFSERMVFHHPEDYDNFIYMIDNVKYDYSVELSKTNERINTAFDKIVSGQETASQAIGAIAEIMQQTLDEYMADFN